MVVDLKMLESTPPWDWPEEAGTIIVSALLDVNAAIKDRMLAAMMAGEFAVLKDKTAEALLKIVNSTSEIDELRSQAADSMAPGLEEAEIEGFDNPGDLPSYSEQEVRNIQASFYQLYHDESVSKMIRRSVLEASAKFPQEWHEGAVRAAYASDDEEWRLTAVVCMRSIKGFDRQILDSLESMNPDIECAAIRAAGNWEIDAAFPHVSKLISSPPSASQKQLLLAAIEAVALIRPRETDMLEPLVESNDDEVSEAAMDALTQAGQAASWDDGLEVLGDEDNEE
jgi:hypothetical protein